MWYATVSNVPVKDTYTRMTTTPLAPSSPWLLRPRPNPQAKLRMFCLPYAGGGASVYVPWANLLPPSIELCAVQLPGRERRIREPAFTSTAGLIAALVPELRPLLDRPFVLFGHSMGALLSFELARALRRQGIQPHALLVSGHRGPQLPPSHPPLHALPQPELIEELRQMNGTPTEVLDHPELLELLVPVIRADFQLCETYGYIPEPPFDFPISAFGGLQDPLCSREELAGWSEQTTAAGTYRMLPGDHFFLHTNRQMLLQALLLDLRRLL